MKDKELRTRVNHLEAELEKLRDFLGVKENTVRQLKIDRNNDDAAFPVILDSIEALEDYLGIEYVEVAKVEEYRKVKKS